jgi:hypothetical protein
MPVDISTEVPIEVLMTPIFKGVCNVSQKHLLFLEIFMFAVRTVALCLMANVAGCASLGYTSHTNDNKRSPKLSQAKYKTIWVPDKIEGDRFIEGHRVHIIEEAGRWLSE